MIGQYKTPLPTSHGYAIHHTLLILTISCKGYAGVPLWFACSAGMADAALAAGAAGLTLTLTLTLTLNPNPNPETGS